MFSFGYNHRGKEKHTHRQNRESFCKILTFRVIISALGRSVETCTPGKNTFLSPAEVPNPEAEGAWSLVELAGTSESPEQTICRDNKMVPSLSTSSPHTFSSSAERADSWGAKAWRALRLGTLGKGPFLVCLMSQVLPITHAYTKKLTWKVHSQTHTQAIDNVITKTVNSPKTSFDVEITKNKNKYTKTKNAEATICVVD